VHAVDGVSMAVRKGELTALVGPDGAGKTSLLRMMAGLLTIDEGTLHVLGHDVASEPQAVQDRISYMPQRFGLYEDLSVQENLDLYADLHGVPPDVRRERFASMLEMTDLARFTDRLAGKLSGGMKQKLGLACTLVRSPDLLLLDEPFGALDALTRIQAQALVGELWQRHHCAILLVTHDVEEALLLADRVLMMQDGVIAHELRVTQPRPRAIEDAELTEMRGQLLGWLGVGHHAVREAA
jgi:ABC-2 type transport system ATP-binding protein